VASAGSDIYGYGDLLHLARVPVVNDQRLGLAGGNAKVDFGNYTWSTGEVLSTITTAGTADLLAINDTASYRHGIRDPDFGSGSVVDVKILHVPSGQYIFDKEVIDQ